MIDLSKVRKGNVIYFRDGRKYEIINVNPNGYLVSELDVNTSVMSHVYFFRHDFLESAVSKKYILSIDY